MLLSIERRRFESFAIGKGGFAFGPTLFPFEEIESIWFERVHTTQYIYWSKTAENDRATMKVRMKSGNVIRLSFNESYFFIGAKVNKKEWIERLSSTYTDLSKVTFPHRLSKYEEQLTQYGFFVYDGARFAPTDRSVTCKGQRFVVGQDNFMLSYGELNFERAKPSLLARTARKIIEETIPSHLPRVVTLSDTDVLFYLLQKHMNLAWTE